MLLYKGVMPDENDFHCVLINFFEDSIAKEMNVEATQCIKPTNFYQIRYWFLFVTIMNLDYKAQKKLIAQ